MCSEYSILHSKNTLIRTFFIQKYDSEQGYNSKLYLSKRLQVWARSPYPQSGRPRLGELRVRERLRGVSCAARAISGVMRVIALRGAKRLYPEHRPTRKRTVFPFTDKRQPSLYLMEVFSSFLIYFSENVSGGLRPPGPANKRQQSL